MSTVICIYVKYFYLLLVYTYIYKYISNVLFKDWVPRKSYKMFKCSLGLKRLKNVGLRV